MNNIFIWCSGADLKTVLRCSNAEINKYKNIGMVVFFVALLASLSASYFIAFSFDQSTSPNLRISYVLVGLLWGFIILSLDRSIVSTISKEESIPDQLIKASPRFIIAIFIGLVISTPLEMKIFEKEINEELKVLIHQDKVSGTQKMLEEKNKLYKENVRQRNELSNERNQKHNLYKEEIEGLISGQVGDGPKAKEYKNAYNRLDSIIDLKTHAIDTIQNEINILNNNTGTVLDITDQEIAKYAGVEKRVEALYSLNAFHWVITCLFILFEILPMIVKLLSPKGDYDTYLRIQKEDFQVKVMDDFKFQARLSEIKRKLDEEKIIEQEKLKNEIETELKIEILKNLSEVQNEVANARIKAFREKSLQSIQELNLNPPPTTVQNIKTNINSNGSVLSNTNINHAHTISKYPPLNPNSLHIEDSTLEEIIWKGEFKDAMNTEFIFQSDVKKDTKKLFFKSGSIIKKNCAWLYNDISNKTIEIIENGSISIYKYYIQDGKLSLSDNKDKAKEYFFENTNA